MKVLLLCQYYPPEQVLVWAHELARELLARGHEVTALTAFPNRDQARIYEGYRGKLYHRETMDGVTVARSWIYATKSKRFYPRALNFGSFCTSSLLTGLLKLPRPDVIYVMIPALPLAVTARLLAWAKRSRLIVNVQDIHPRVAVEYGMLKNRAAVRFFEGMERWVYRHADKVAVISEGMREDLVSRGVPDDKVRVVENWADPNFITPGAKENEFRDELRAEGRFVLTYSGGINNNANLEPVVEAAELLRDEPFLFAIVGDGQYKPHLVELAEKKSLDNVRFLPFQPLDRYPDVLRAADMNFVSLNVRSATTSVPSKIYKQMAAGRPILAATPSTNELYRLVNAANCGKCIVPDDSQAIADVLRWARQHPEELDRMGCNARRHLEKHHSLEKSVDKICMMFDEITDGRTPNGLS